VMSARCCINSDASIHVLAFCVFQALRLLLGCMQTHASRFKRYIVPLVSLSIDFYIRVFVRVYTSAQIVKRAAR
jgi:tRNA (guanine26-N2/guanine27-N2)-dimethyltransferase